MRIIKDDEIYNLYLLFNVPNCLLLKERNLTFEIGSNSHVKTGLNKFPAKLVISKVFEETGTAIY